MANLLSVKILLLLAALGVILAAIAADVHKVAQAVPPTPTPVVEKSTPKPMHLSGMEKTVFDKDLK